MRVGLISDTHDLLRPEALAALGGCDHLVHAGDIMGRAVLDALSALAPLTVVRGNNDRGDWAASLPDTDLVRLDGVLLYVIHDLSRIDIDPAAAGVSVVVSGHTHQPRIREEDGILYVNPGSAGPRRFSLPIAVAELSIAGAAVSARIVELHPEPAAPSARRRRTTQRQ